MSKADDGSCHVHSGADSSAISIVTEFDQLQNGHAINPVVIGRRSMFAKFTASPHFGHRWTLSHCLASFGFAGSGIFGDLLAALVSLSVKEKESSSVFLVNYRFSRPSAQPLCIPSLHRSNHKRDTNEAMRSVSAMRISASI